MAREEAPVVLLEPDPKPELVPVAAAAAAAAVAEVGGAWRFRSPVSSCGVYVSVVVPPSSS